MSKRLGVLENSLQKKNQKFGAKLSAHFSDVRSANGQPLNDKRCGASTMHRWDKQNDALRSQQVSIEKTEAAIEREKAAISLVESQDVPQALRDLLAAGVITQWRKFPNTFFVVGVDKGRIIWTGTGLAHRYLSEIPKEQYPLFRDVYNGARKSLALDGAA